MKRLTTQVAIRANEDLNNPGARNAADRAIIAPSAAPLNEIRFFFALHSTPSHSLPASGAILIDSGSTQYLWSAS